MAKKKEKPAKEKKMAKKKKEKEKETMRQSAAKLRKDLAEFIDLMESKGSNLSPEELQGFEERQFSHITSKVADAIINRVGEGKFRKISEKLKKNQISMKDAATELGLKMGDLVLILEARKVFSEAELRKRLESRP